MLLLWVTLLLLHHGYALVPLITVPLGEPVTLTCAALDTTQSSSLIHWYKQSAGDILKLILMHQKNIKPIFKPEFPASRFSAKSDEKTSELTILRTVQQDEGMYHCAHVDYSKSTWSGIYLSIKGSTERTFNYSVVHQLNESDPADSKELQCSILSDSNNETCSGDVGVFWFRARSNTSYPDIIYTDGNRAANCDKKRDTERRCRYQFSKNISSSDAGTYLCAVATCGQILFGNRTNLNKDETPSSGNYSMMVSIICLAISVTVNIIFIFYRIRQSACKQRKETRNNDMNQLDHSNTEVGQDLNYAALHFSGGEAPRGKKRRELRTEDSVYSQVKGSM